MTRFSKDDRREMCRMRQQGASLNEIARHFGTSRQLVHVYTPALTLDVQADIVDRRRAECLAERSDLWTANEDRELIEMWRRWKSVARISQSGRLNRSLHAIDSRVRDKGLRERFSGHRPTGSPITLPFVSILFGPAPKPEKEQAA